MSIAEVSPFESFAVLPPRVADKIAAFLLAGNTGQIELHVKDGRILAYKVVDCGTVAHDERDDRRRPTVETAHDTGR